ncbi:MAG: DUF1501 domain-containing protein [Planctomycetota bacterium]
MKKLTSNLELSRRGFLQFAGAAAGAAAASSWLPRIAFAANRSGAGRDVVVTIFLRGGADGLSLVPPHADPNYYIHRPNLSVPKPSSASPNKCIDLNGFFGFHPALAPLLPAYQAGRLLVINATGSPVANRSHFEKERIVEFGDLTGSIGSGWLARHLLTINAMTPGSLLRGMGVRTSPQHALVGAPLTLPIADPTTFGLAGSPSSEAARKKALTDMYSNISGDLKDNGLNTLATLELLKSVGINNYIPSNGAVYPTTGSFSSFGKGLFSAAALIKAQVGVEAIAIDLADWDTHGTQGVFNGTFNSLADALAKGLAAFDQDLSGAASPGVTTIVMSEFGRTVRENGNAGTDHGFGNAMFLLGKAVNGGQVVTQWPGLAANQLFEGQDLNITIDYRDVLAEVVDKRLQNTNIAGVFPGYSPAYHNLVN